MPDHPYGWLSLLPPLVAIALAVVTRRIVLSLVLGIFSGALLMAGGDPLRALQQTWEIHLWNTLVDPGKLRVFSFTLFMGALVGVMTRSGGMQGLIEHVTPWAHNRRRGQLTTWALGLLVFFDDYANTILLGSTLRPICDRLRISREKLAYLVDSTAAPVAGLALVSTWVAVEIEYIASGVEAIDGVDYSPFGLFLASIPYRFYVWGALFFVWLTAWSGRDFGAMFRAEQSAARGEPSPGRVEVVGDDAFEVPRAGWYHAVVPIGVTLGLVLLFILRTGSSAVCADRLALGERLTAAEVAGTPAQQSALLALREATASGDVTSTVRASVALGSTLTSEDAAASLAAPIFWRDVIGAADSSLALQYGALAGLIVAMLMAALWRLLPGDEILASAMAGARVVLPAVVILWMASTMSRMTTDESYSGEASVAFEYQDHRLYTAAYLSSVLAGDETSAAEAESSWTTKLFPSVVFLLAAVVAFCTGTSWGTMGILVPMVVQTAHVLLAREMGAVPEGHPILLSSVAGVLAGAVFGDHCSPISDTTVLSSQACGCDHIAHVWTQMPYALVVALVSVLLGTLPIGFGVPVWVLLPLQVLALVAVMRYGGRRVEPGAA